MPKWGNYPVSTKVQHRNGYIKVKIEGDDGKPRWEAESRRVWELQRGPLSPGDRVFHVDGDRTNNRITNLAKVHYNEVKFVFLKQSRVLFMPKIKEANRGMDRQEKKLQTAGPHRR